MKTHIEIDSKSLIHNLSLFKKLSPKKIMFVVKANAYGHGLKEIITITKNLPIIDYYAVDSLNEAMLVKGMDSKKRILVIGWEDDKELEELILNGFEMIVPSMVFLNRVNEISRRIETKARLHLKMETGVSRLGMEPSEILAVFDDSVYCHVEITGLYSHFANIEDTTDHSFAQHQLKIFNDVVSKIKKNDLLKHFSCSASTLLFPETNFDMVRVGISAYGYWPSKPTYVSYKEKNGGEIDLKPVLSWYSKVAQVKSLEKDKYIGYGLTYKTFNKARIIVIPVGYYDGFDRKLSNVSNIIVNGTKAPVRGRVCMDMFMAEVTHIKNVKEGDRVVLLGEDGDERIDADDLAEWIGSINYEVLARINPVIPRIVVNK